MSVRFFLIHFSAPHPVHGMIHPEAFSRESADIYVDLSAHGARAVEYKVEIPPLDIICDSFSRRLYATTATTVSNNNGRFYRNPSNQFFA